MLHSNQAGENVEENNAHLVCLVPAIWQQTWKTTDGHKYQQIATSWQLDQGKAAAFCKMLTRNSDLVAYLQKNSGSFQRQEQLDT